MKLTEISNIDNFHKQLQTAKVVIFCIGFLEATALQLLQHLIHQKFEDQKFQNNIQRIPRLYHNFPEPELFLKRLIKPTLKNFL